MAVKGTSSVKFRFPAAPKAPKPKAATIAGPPVAKFKAPSALKIPSLPSLSMQSRRGLAPKEQLAKAAAGSSSNTRKRNSNYPTP